MKEAIGILEHSEVVLMKKIKVMKDGKPKYSASEKLREIRQAISVLKQLENVMDVSSEDEEELLRQEFINNPPTAKA